PQAVEAIPDSLLERLLAEPDRAPEHLAQAIAARFADPAAQWALMHDARSKPKHAAKLARRKYTMRARVMGAGLGLGGITTAALDLATLGWLQGRMVFLIASSYGYDPHDPMRPAELLYLWGVYGSPQEARAGLDREGDHMALAFANEKLTGDERSRGASALVSLLGRYFLKRSLIRAIPLVASPINAVANGRATKDLGNRAMKFYGG
ncbi:MAG: EcsC family protein, partial [Thermoleophilaceae bacterium]|nr:EcsC family protein [Thermoleophilaceae bacterium]